MSGRGKLGRGESQGMQGEERSSEFVSGGQGRTHLQGDMCVDGDRSTVSFSCDPGYRLSHEEPLLCEKNHWWSHPLPTCDGKNSFNMQNKLIYKPKKKST